MAAGNDMDLRLIVQLVIIGLTFFMLINASAVLVLAERKVMAFMQQRYGPYLTGPWGLLQPLADILKLLMKEELRPKGADKWLFTLAPVLAVTTAFAAFDARRPAGPLSPPKKPGVCTLSTALNTLPGKTFLATLRNAPAPTSAMVLTVVSGCATAV